MAYEQLDVEYREKVRYQHTDRRGELERILVSAEGERHMMGARTVDERQLGDARTVDEVAHGEAEDEVKGDGSPVEAGHALGRPRQHHLLDGEQQQIPRGDVRVTPEEELAVPQSAHEGIEASLARGPHQRRPHESVADDTDHGVQDDL